MKLVHSIETSRLIIREFTKEDALFAASIWNDPTMGEYLPDESMTEIDPGSNGIMKKLGFEIVDTMSYLKRGTTMTFKDYLYEKILN